MSWFSVKFVYLRLKQLYFILFVRTDASREKFLDFGSFKDDAHDKIIYIFVFNEFATL